jgi:hypothetical protein
MGKLDALSCAALIRPDAKINYHAQQDHGNWQEFEFIHWSLPVVSNPGYHLLA